MPPPFTSKTHTALLASVSVKPASSCKPTDFIFINARPRFPLVRCQSPGVLDEEGIDGFLITLSEEEGQVSFLKAFENNPAPSVHIYDNEYLTFDAAWWGRTNTNDKYTHMKDEMQLFHLSLTAPKRRR